MDEIIEFINQQQRTEELERVTANFHEKIRRRRDGTPPDYQAFYEAKTGVYYIPDGLGNFTSVNESGVKEYLMIEKGIISTRDKSGFSPLDQALHDLHKHYHVGYAGKLAGYRPGIEVQNGERILVTKGPILIESESGDFPVTDALLTRLLGSEQRAYFDS